MEIRCPKSHEIRLVLSEAEIILLSTWSQVCRETEQQETGGCLQEANATLPAF